MADEREQDLTINALQEFWAELLNHSSIGLDDSFFQLGADSITVLKLIFRIQQSFGLRLLYRDIFENPTINLQACLIKKRQNFDGRLDE